MLHRYDFYSGLNTSSLLPFNENHHLTLHRRYFLRGSALNALSPFPSSVSLFRCAVDRPVHKY
jgi:hypothetical protein